VTPVRQPHDSWAEAYDLAYEEEFGALYARLTDLSVEVITGLLPPGGSIVDFGAGTGRLAIPLARAGYRVTAVEPSSAMLEQLRQRDAAVQVDCVHAAMQDFESAARFDLAICVFTVVTYLLDEQALAAAMGAASRCLKSRGKLLADVPSRAVFASRSASTGRMSREVTVQRLARNAPLYRYEEHLTVEGAGGTNSYRDAFTIRHWTREQVLEAALAAGLALDRDLSEAFAGTGSEYLLLRKVD
jgi:FkbM family methyltransferase